MSTAITKADDQFALVEQVVINGDLSRLSADQRVQYYNRVCESMGLNPYTRPFDYITLNSKLTLYAKKDAAEQLRKLHGISINGLDGRMVDDLYIVVATAVDRNGRIDQATGAVSVAGLKGEAKANAIMKAETKAKRRVTLSIAGLGWTDESEVDSIPGAQRVAVDMATGEILTAGQPQPAQIVTVAAPIAQPVDEPPAEVEFMPPAEPNPFDDPAAGVQAEPDLDYAAMADALTGDCLKLAEWAAKLHTGGTGPASGPQYGYLTKAIDDATGGAHTVVLSTLCRRHVTADNPCSKNLAAKLLDYILPQIAQKDAQGKSMKGADGKVIYVPNPAYRADYADCLRSIAQAQRVTA